MNTLLILSFVTSLFINNVGDEVTIINTLGPNPPTEVIITGIDETGDFMDILEFTKTNPFGTLELALSSIPVIIDDGVPFFEFLLRLNETGGPNSFASMNQFEMSVGGMDFFRLVETSLGTGNGSLGFGESVIFTDFGPGNNQADGSIKLPVELFNGFDSSEQARISVQMSDIEAGADFLSKYEERFLPPGVIGGPTVPPYPEPSRALLLLFGFVVLALRRHR